MTDDAFDADIAHRHFSADCFNQAWKLLDKHDRTVDDNEQLIHLAHASLWHWTQRKDVSDENLSIGYWQVSRVYAVVKQAGNARKYARLCLGKTPADSPFLLGYAYEALARAEAVGGNIQQAGKFLSDARRHADEVTAADDWNLLAADLKELEQAVAEIEK